MPYPAHPWEAVHKAVLRNVAEASEGAYSYANQAQREPVQQGPYPFFKGSYIVFKGLTTGSYLFQGRIIGEIWGKAFLGRPYLKVVWWSDKPFFKEAFIPILPYHFPYLKKG